MGTRDSTGSVAADRRHTQVAYRLEANADKERTLDSVQDLEDLLHDLRRRESNDILITRIDGRRIGFERLLYRALGLGTELVSGSLSVLTKGELATVTYLDLDFNEWRASLPEEAAGSGDVEFVLMDGTRERLAMADCMPIDVAWRAARDFVDRGRRPDWLRFRRIG